ncbi:insulin receptor substrate 1, partial [Leptidea sinapis]|uniref:insulin receptor substrate 1 n=1 Tax=Leptidea sinapis TaxID=189913 RepID=UPI0021C2E8E2
MAAISEGGAIVRQGHLRKLKTMKKKYFVLRAESSESSARLEYYESEKKFRSGAAPRRVLPLKSCYNIMRRLDLKQKHVIALFTREEQLCIVAENEADLHAWLAAILKLFRNEDATEDLLHPIQHVWQVNVQKKGLGASKNIQGLYNLCLTDKTLTLVKIKSHNNVISDLGIPERVEYSLKNIRRCGDSECFFYMEVGRQTTSGAGELWMHSDDSNIAQSMHSTIYHAMRNCAKETENEKDHIVVGARASGPPDGPQPPARRQTYSDGRGRAGLYNDGGTLRNRCDTMPSRICPAYEPERLTATPRDADVVDGTSSSRDDIDSLSEWYRTLRIPEEPDACDALPRDFIGIRGGGPSISHSRTSSLGVEEGGGAAEGYLPMAPAHLSSSGSLCSGTPSTDPRFSEYQLEPATAHFAEERSTRAYSVGSRPGGGARPEPARLRAYSAGSRRRPAHHPPHPPHPRSSTEDLMEIDFSANSPQTKVIIARTPPTNIPDTYRRNNVDEYVDMSPRNAGYVEMRPGELPATPNSTPGATPQSTPSATPDGYVEMSYGRGNRVASRPIAIAGSRPPPAASSPRTPHGSQTIFPFSPDGASPPAPDDGPALSTLREISEEGRRSPPEVSSSPQYVTLARPPPLNNNKEDTRGAVRGSPPRGDAAPPGALHYAALD